MKDTRSLLGEYILTISKGDDIDLERFIADHLKRNDLQTLKNYSNDEKIYFRSGSGKKTIINNIYNSCNRVLGYMILGTRRYEDDTREDFYKRIYLKQFKC